MRYFVVAQDGKEYGPAEVDLLRQWVAQGRINAQSKLRLDGTADHITAAAVTGLFSDGAPTSAAEPPVAQPTAQSDYAPGYDMPKQSPAPNPYANPPTYSSPPSYDAAASRARVVNDFSTDRRELIGIVVRCAIALLLVTLFRYAGLIISIYACVYAFQYGPGNKYGAYMIGMAVITVLIVGSTWLLRFNGMFG